MRIAAIDLDGTMLRTDCTISSYSKEMVKLASQNDIIVVPTSGRSFRSIWRQVSDMDGMYYTIGANGSIVTDAKTEEILYERTFAVKTAYEIYTHVRDTGAYFACYNENDSYYEKGKEALFYAGEISKEICDDLLSTEIPVLSLDLLIRRGTMKVSKFFISYPDTGDLGRFEEFLKGYSDIKYGYSTPYSIEIFPAGADKDGALDFLCKRCGVRVENTVAIGDGQTDIGMIRFAGLGVAVENAMDSLKAEADMIGPGNDQDGPARILERMVAGEL